MFLIYLGCFRQSGAVLVPIFGPVCNGRPLRGWHDCCHILTVPITTTKGKTVNNIGDFLVLGILFAFFWAVAVLVYLARIHYELKKRDKTTANLLREMILRSAKQHGENAVLQVTKKDVPMPVRRPVAKPSSAPPPVDIPLPASEEWPGWYQDESGEWHQTKES